MLFTYVYTNIFVYMWHILISLAEGRYEELPHFENQAGSQDLGPGAQGQDRWAPGAGPIPGLRRGA